MTDQARTVRCTRAVASTGSTASRGGSATRTSPTGTGTRRARRRSSSSPAATSPPINAASSAPRPPGVGAARRRPPSRRGTRRQRWRAAIPRRTLRWRSTPPRDMLIVTRIDPPKRSRALPGVGQRPRCHRLTVGAGHELLTMNPAREANRQPEPTQDRGDTEADQEPVPVGEVEAAERLAPCPDDEHSDQRDVARRSRRGCSGRHPSRQRLDRRPASRGSECSVPCRPRPAGASLLANERHSGDEQRAGREAVRNRAGEAELAPT